VPHFVFPRFGDGPAPAVVYGFRSIFFRQIGGMGSGAADVVVPPEPRPPAPDAGGAGSPVRRPRLSVGQAYGPAFPNLVRRSIEEHDFDPREAAILARDADALVREAAELAAERDAQKFAALSERLQAKIEAFEELRDQYIAELERQDDDIAALLLLLN